MRTMEVYFKANSRNGISKLYLVTKITDYRHENGMQDFYNREVVAGFSTAEEAQLYADYMNAKWEVQPL